MTSRRMLIAFGQRDRLRTLLSNAPEGVWIPTFNESMLLTEGAGAIIARAFVIGIAAGYDLIECDKTSDFFRITRDGLAFLAECEASDD